MARHIEDNRTKKSRAHENSTEKWKNRRMNECGNCATIYSRVSIDHYLIFLLFSLYFSGQIFWLMTVMISKFSIVWYICCVKPVDQWQWWHPNLQLFSLFVASNLLINDSDDIRIFNCLVYLLYQIFRLMTVMTSRFSIV